jgi:Mg/Co/Ni transporter MgtE
MSSVAEKLQRKTQRSVATKQVRLKLVYIDFWSAVKLSFLIGICLGIVLIVASAFIYIAVQNSGVFASIDGLLQDVLGDPNFSVESNFSLSTVMTFAVVLALLNLVIGTVLGAIACLLYNLSVRLTGGLLVGFTNN